MYAEYIKSKNGELDARTKCILEVFVPSFSVCALLAVTAYVTSDAVNVLMNNGEDDDVNVYFMYAFAAANFIVDVISVAMFFARGDKAFHDEAEQMTFRASIRPFSLDGRVNHFDVTTEPDGEHSANLNMLSAFTHVGGDSLRTAAVFIAALITTFGGVDSTLTDAYAAIIVSITIVLAVIPLCLEIFKAAKRHFFYDTGKN
jgi:Co/Zn/Cd efflux system component